MLAVRVPLWRVVTGYTLKSNGRRTSQWRDMWAKNEAQAIEDHRKYVDEANGRFISEMLHSEAFLLPEGSVPAMQGEVPNPPKIR
jgi:hypothetical protein